MKGAILGFGEVCEKAHAPAFRREPGLEIVAVADTDPGRRAAAAKLFHGIRGYASPQALLDAEKGLDFVDIATPPHLHAGQALLALERRLHVLCEKPLTLQHQELEALRRESRARRRVVFPVHNWKHAPLLEKLRQLVAERIIGSIRHIEWHVLRKQPAAVAVADKGNWRTDRLLSGGGILMDHGWHAFYLLSWLLGKAPSRVTGILNFPHAGSKRGDSEEEAVCLIEYPKTSAVAYFTWKATGRGHWGILYGNEGTITVRDDRLIVVRGNDPEQTYAFPEPLSRGSAHPEWFRGTLADFKAATADHALGDAALDEAGHCLMLLEELYRRHRAPEADACRQAP